MRSLRRILSDHRGVAAVEMALIAPVAAVLALLSFQVWQASTQTEDMRGAVKTGIRYYMNGGTDDAAAQTLMQSAWDKAPNDAAVSVSRQCLCGTTVQACNVNCADGTAPIMVVTLNASGTNPGALFGSSLSDREVLRVR